MSSPSKNDDSIIVSNYVSLRDVDEENNKKARSRTVSHDDEPRHGFIMWHPPSLIILMLTGTFLNMECK